MSKSKLLFLFSTLALIALVLVACAQPTPQVITEKVIETVVVEKEGQTVIETVEVDKEVVVTQIVEKEVIVEVTPEPVLRKGGWLDTVVMVADPSVESAVARLLAGDIDVYAQSSSNAEAFQTVKDEGLGYVEVYGSYNDLTMNTYGPIFDGTGGLNPFGIR
jgi:hypothetical protein